MNSTWARPRRACAVMTTGAAVALLAGACSSPSAPPKKAAAKAPAPAAPVASTSPPVYPLTGLPETDPSAANRPALSVKIDNVADALPQFGLNQADIVTQALVEGGLTRLMATFQSAQAPQVGPIRSARPVDGYLLRELGGGVFAISGADAGEIAPVKQYSTSVILSHDAGAAGFFLLRGRSAPHNVFSSTSALWAAGAAAGAAQKPPPQLFTYSAAVPAAPPATQANLSFSNSSSAGWTFDPNTNHYLRIQDGRIDNVASGQRVWTDNVVVLSTPVAHTGNIDRAGNEDPLDVVIGSGQAWVLRNGKVVTGTWTRPSVNVAVAVHDASGQVIALQPGRTWIELLPSGNQPTFK